MIYGINGSHGGEPFVASVMTHDGVVTGTTAHLRWAKGKHLGELAHYCPTRLGCTASSSTLMRSTSWLVSTTTESWRLYLTIQ